MQIMIQEMKLSIIQKKKKDNKIGANESMFILTILEKIKETRLKCFRGSVTVL